MTWRRLVRVASWEGVARSVLMGSLVGLAAWGVASWLELVEIPWMGPLLALGVGVGFFVLAWWPRPDVQRAEGPNITPNAKGGFEWRPAGEPTPFHPGRGIRHGWWDLDHAPRLRMPLLYRVDDGVDAEALAKATRRALRAARRALPGRGRARALGAFRDIIGPLSEVKVDLELQAFGLDAEAAARAKAAFDEAFLRALARAGVVAHQRP